MDTLRIWAARRRGLAALIVAAALLARLIVPAGFMPMVDGGRIVLMLCSGYGPMPAPEAGPAAHAMAGMHAMPGMAHHDDPSSTSQSPCAFADLALPVLGGADPVLLAAAILFAVMAALFAAAPLPVRRPARLRPPLRGPPAFA